MYGWEYANEDRSPSTYEKRLDKLVARLKDTGATLIWGTTTPVCPAPEKTMLKRFETKIAITPTIEKHYSDAALRVMEKHQVQVNDLHALMAPNRKKYALSANDVHYTQEGYAMLGRQVAACIAKNLNGDPAHGPRETNPPEHGSIGGSCGTFRVE
jgi:acyl-CoA thioesterase-1